MGHRTSRRLGVPLILFLVAISCSTKPEPETKPVDYSTLKLEELESLAVTDLEACVEALSIISLSASRDPGLDDETLSKLANLATGKLVARLGVELDGGLWRAAERSLASLQAIGSAGKGFLVGASDMAREAVPRGVAIRVNLGRADEYVKKKLYSPAASYLHRALDLAYSDETSLEEWFYRAEKAKDEATARRILSLLPTATSEKLSETAGNGKIETTLEKKAAGVVTVYVDKGLKIENGVGYPDRVLGTAFQVDSSGYYITNYHVVSSEVDPAYDGYSRLSIRPTSNPEARIPAKVVGWNEDLDLALVKSQEISPHTFYPFKPEKAFKGQKVYAIGSPVGLENSVTAGIVSATGRRILPRGDAIQIDAPVNPGNSGGPLLDEDGNLLGIVFAGLPNFQGLNFALPTNWASTVFPSLFDEGKVETSWLGLGIAKNLDSSLDVSYVYPGRGGIEPGDTLISIDGKRFADIQEAQMLVAAKPIGSLCSEEIRKEGKIIVLLRKTEAFPEIPFRKASQHDTAEHLLQGVTGMLLDHLSGPRGSGGTYKVAKTWPGMIADESGIGEADVLKLLRYYVDSRKNSIQFDVSVKSLNSGYLERAMRMELSLETDNFL
ncbi:MAG TPA: trypsin-like peptidase domain-containing protein [Rectinemataceae bacterium]|nr:trypsin-like peptidase domain-containing protein [Rectinemataceae bacterium]